MPAAGVVGAAGEVRRDPVLEREPRGLHGAHGGQSAAAHERRAPRQSKPPDGGRVKRAVAKRVEVRAVVRERQQLPRRLLGSVDPLRVERSLRHEEVAQEPELAHRERVSRRKRHLVGGMEAGAHAATLGRVRAGVHRLAGIVSFIPGFSAAGSPLSSPAFASRIRFQSASLP